MQDIPAVFWFLSALILVLSIAWHEFCHAIAAKIVRMRIKSVHVGLPYRPMVRFRIRGLLVTVSPYMFGGGVLIEDSDFENVYWWKRVLVAISGPVGNMALALIIAILMFGFNQGVEISQGFAVASIQATGQVVSLQVSLDQMMGPLGLIGFMARVLQADFWLGFAFCTIVLNMTVAITNLIPLPALDGGLIVMAILRLIIAKLSPGRVKTLNVLEKGLRQTTYWALLLGVVLLLLKDALMLYFSRMGWF